MFKELYEIVKQEKAINLTLTAEGDQMTVVVIPKGGDNTALMRPLSLTGTPEELDAGFAEAIGTATASRASLREQIEEYNALLEAERKAQAEKAKSKVTKGAAKPKAAAPQESGDDDGEGEDAQAPAAPIKPAAPPKTDAIDLF